ncbi:hypothetical protein H106_00838 [Trichophyton rubrum CBS 735.88]|nr:hypothetical protein H106_00838 [Trichophyton rubrum CBS 735.88]
MGVMAFVSKIASRSKWRRFSLFFCCFVYLLFPVFYSSLEVPAGYPLHTPVIFFDDRSLQWVRCSIGFSIGFRLIGGRCLVFNCTFRVSCTYRWSRKYCGGYNVSAGFTA